MPRPCCAAINANTETYTTQRDQWRLLYYRFTVFLFWCDPWPYFVTAPYMLSNGSFSCFDDLGGVLF